MGNLLTNALDIVPGHPAIGIAILVALWIGMHWLVRTAVPRAGSPRRKR